jgi:hypothetical protein
MDRPPHAADQDSGARVAELMRLPSAGELDLYLSGKGDAALMQRIALLIRLDRSFAKQLARLERERKGMLKAAYAAESRVSLTSGARLAYSLGGLFVLAVAVSYFAGLASAGPVIVSVNALEGSVAADSTLVVLMPKREPFTMVLTKRAFDRQGRLDLKLRALRLPAAGLEAGFYIAGPGASRIAAGQWIGAARLMPGENPVQFLPSQNSAQAAADWQAWVASYRQGYVTRDGRQLSPAMKRYSPLRMADQHFLEIARGVLPEDLGTIYSEMATAYFDDVKVYFDGSPALSEDFETTPLGEYPDSLYNLWSGRDGVVASAPGRPGHVFRADYYPRWNRHDGIPLREADLVAAAARQLSYELRFVAESWAGVSMGFHLPVQGTSGGEQPGLFEYAGERAHLTARGGKIVVDEWTYAGVVPQSKEVFICKFQPKHWYRVKAVHDIAKRETTVSVWDESLKQQQPDTQLYKDLGYFPANEAVDPPASTPVESWRFTWFSFGGNFYAPEGL